MANETKSLTVQLEKFNKRIGELDVIIKKTYENNVLDVLSNERFAVLLKDYEQEQSELKEKVVAIQNQIHTFRQTKSNATDFVALVKKYIGIETLDSVIVNELIDRIEVSEQYEQDGQKMQDVEIYYKFAGNVAV